MYIYFHFTCHIFFISSKIDRTSLIQEKRKPASYLAEVWDFLSLIRGSWGSLDFNELIKIQAQITVVCMCVNYSLWGTYRFSKYFRCFWLFPKQVRCLYVFFNVRELHKICRPNLTLILRRSRTGMVWFYTSTSNKRAARPKLYTKSLTRDLKRMYSRFALVRISINL